MSKQRQTPTQTQTQTPAAATPAAGVSNSAVAAALLPSKDLRPLPSGALAPGSTIDTAHLLSEIGALWREIAVWGDDSGEDNFLGDFPFFSESSIGNFGYDPTFEGSDIEDRIASIPVSYWRESNFWSEKFSACLGTSGIIQINARVRDHSLLQNVQMEMAATSGGTMDSKASWAQEFTATSSGDEHEETIGLLFEESTTAGVAGETTSSATVDGQLMSADLVFDVTLMFDRMLEGRFGPKTISIEAGKVNLLGVGL